jgi:protease I
VKEKKMYRRLLAVVAGVSLTCVACCYGEIKARAGVARILVVVSPADFTDQEYYDTRSALDAAHAKVTVASTTTSQAVSHDGRRLKVDVALPKVQVGDFDAIVLVGGAGILSGLLDFLPLRKLLIDASKSEKVIAAICIAPMILARAGLLKGVRATCYLDKAVVGELKANGADYVEQQVVVTGRIITASGPGASGAFGKAVIAAVSASSPLTTRGPSLGSAMGGAVWIGESTVESAPI